MTRLPPLLAALLLPTLAGLAACGGSDDSGAGAASSSAAAPTSAAAAPTPSPSPSVDLTLLGISAQSVGIDVFQWSVDHKFRYPADQAEFRTVKLSDPLPEGRKAGYRKAGAKKYEVCLTQYAGSEPAAWAIYESSTGLYTNGAGAPTEDFCP